MLRLQLILNNTYDVESPEINIHSGLYSHTHTCTHARTHTHIRMYVAICIILCLWYNACLIEMPWRTALLNLVLTDS